MTAKNSNRYMLILVAYQLFLTFLITVLFYVFDINLPMPLYIVLSQAAAFLVPFCLYLFFTKRKLSDVLMLKKISIKNLMLIFLMIILFEPLMSFLSALTMLFFNNNVSDVMMDLYSYPIWMVVLTLAVTPAICEEITMRGVILSGYRDAPVLKGALINGLFFGIMHMDAQQFLYAFFLGVVFYYIVYYTRSIFASMFAHFIVNGTQSLMAYASLYFLDSQVQDISEIAEIPSLFQNINENLLALLSTGILALITAPFAFALLYYFIFYNKKKNNQYVASGDDLVTSHKAFDVYSVAVVVIYVLYIVLSVILSMVI